MQELEKQGVNMTNLSEKEKFNFSIRLSKLRLAYLLMTKLSMSTMSMVKVMVS